MQLNKYFCNLKFRLIKNIKFSSTIEQEFSQTLKERINEYFKSNNIKKQANAEMYVKTVIMLLVYISPILIVSLDIVSSSFLAILLYAVSGLGIAGIGMGIMHDANHGAYTTNPKLSFFLGHTLDFLGCSSKMWKFQHNILHHTYTNIHGHDEDITAPVFLLRFSPHSKLYKIQKYQHYYVWFFYSLLTLFWVTGKDFVKCTYYYKIGLIPNKKAYRLQLLKFIPLKLYYFTTVVFLPYYFSSFSLGTIITGFLVMHFLAGLLLSIVFQMAHVVPNMEFPEPPERDDKMDENWFIHQLQTTSNFSPNNKLLFWYLGGLTNQVEHHLFPKICHVHYPKLSKIVAQTAKDFSVPYHVNKSFLSALSGHIKILKALGRG